VFKFNVIFGLFVGILLSSSAQSATVEVEVTIKSVDVKARGITVGYESPTWQKTIQLVVAPKAEISVDGKPGTIESLKVDQKAAVLFDKELLVVTKIDVKGGGEEAATSKPRTQAGSTRAAGDETEKMSLVEVSELQQRAWPACLSEDGLTIYFGLGRIYTAHRKDTDSLFENERPLFEGLEPAVTNDGLEVIVVGAKTVAPTPEPKSFCSATRDSTKEAFRRPKPIPELRDPPEMKDWSRNPYLSPDGLTLYFHRYPKDRPHEFVFCTRPDRHSPWSTPQPIKMKGNNLFNGLSCPFVTDDGMSLFCVNEGGDMNSKGNLLKFTRSNTSEPFAEPEFVELEGLSKLIGRTPRYVPATKELFFFQSDGADLARGHLIIVKNFKP
jgi:hypothetical protein